MTTLNDLFAPLPAGHSVSVAEPSQRPEPKPVAGCPHRFLFGVIVQDPRRLPPTVDSAAYWLGVRFSMTAAVSASVMAMRVFGLHATEEHARSVFQFGTLEGPNAFDQDLVLAWTMDCERRGIWLLNDVCPKTGLPIIESL